MKTTNKQSVKAASRKPGERPPELFPAKPVPPEWQAPEPGSPRARIVAAARELFAEQGLEGTSIREITVAAKVNAAMVHYYFGSKDELYRRVLGLELLAVFRAMQNQIQTNLPASELLIGLPLRILRVVRANPVWAKLFRQEMAMGAPHVEKVVRELDQAGPLGVKSRFATLYRAAVQRGELRDLPAEMVIQYLIILGYSGVFYQPFFRIMSGADPHDEKVFEERLKTFDTLIREGLMPKKKSQVHP